MAHDPGPRRRPAASRSGRGDRGSAARRGGAGRSPSRPGTRSSSVRDRRRRPCRASAPRTSSLQLLHLADEPSPRQRGRRTHAARNAVRPIGALNLVGEHRRGGWRGPAFDVLGDQAAHPARVRFPPVARMVATSPGGARVSSRWCASGFVLVEGFPAQAGLVTRGCTRRNGIREDARTSRWPSSLVIESGALTGGRCRAVSWPGSGHSGRAMLLVHDRQDRARGHRETDQSHSSWGAADRRGGSPVSCRAVSTVH